MAVTRIGLSGLSTDVNPRKAQPGAMEVATNVVCRSEDVIEPRPGLYQSAQYTGIGDAQRVVHYDGAVTTIDDSGVEAFGIGDIVDRDAASITGFNGYCDATEARGNLYIASQKGLQKVTSGSVTLSDWAGLLPAAMFFELALSSSYSTNWLANGSKAAYRLVTRREDANDVTVTSAASGYTSLTNGTGSARSIDITIYLNTVARAGDVIEVYRTKTYTVTSAPNAFYYAGEVTLTSAHVSAGNLTYSDLTLDTLLGRPLYSGSGQEGAAHARPRIAKAVCSFAGSIVSGNLISPQYKRLLLAATNPAAVSYTTTVTSGSPTVTLGSLISLEYAGAAVVVGQHVYDATYFPSGAKVVGVAGSTITLDTNASASGSPTLNFDDVVEITDGTTTERYLSNVLMKSMNTAVVIEPGLTVGPSALAHSTNVDDLGLFTYSYDTFIEALIPGAATLQIKATNGATRFREPLPEYGSGFDDMDQDERPSLVEWSLLNQPEHFNRGLKQAFVGGKGKGVWSLVPFAGRLFMFKADGVFVMDGDSERAGFRVEELSPLHVIMSPRHACAGVDAAYAWTTEGVIALGASGAITNVSNQVVSRKLRPFVASEAGLLGGMWFADNEVHLVARQTLEDVTQSVYLVYNTETKQWTEWTINGTAVGGCAPGASLYGHLSRFAVLTSDGGDVHLWQAPTRITVSGNEAPPEYYAADLITGTTTVTATPAAAGTNLYSFTASFSSFGIVPGIGDMLISPAQAWKGVITAVTNNGGGSYTMTFYSRDTVTASSATIQALYGFSVELKLVPIASQDPLAWRHWMAAHWEILGPMSLYTVRVGTESTSGYAGSEPIVYQRARNFPTYTDPGDGAPYQLGFKPRYLFSRKHAHAASVQPTLTIDEGGAIWRLSAISLEESRGSHKTHRNTA